MARPAGRDVHGRVLARLHVRVALPEVLGGRRAYPSRQGRQPPPGGRRRVARAGAGLKLTVLLFARPREGVGVARVALEVPEGSTTASGFDHLQRDHPRLAGMTPNLRCAVALASACWRT